MLFYLFGDDSFRLAEKVSQMKNKFVQSNSSGPSPSVLDFEEGALVSELSPLLGTQGLFSPKNFVIVKNFAALKAADTKTLAKLIESKAKELAADQNTVILFQQSPAPKNKNVLHDLLLKISKKERFEKLTAEKLQTWTKERLAKENPNLTISQQALNTLIERSEQDTTKIASELAKLSSLKLDGELLIEDIEQMVSLKVSSNIFGAVEALCQNNPQRALELLHREIASGTDPFYILSMYAYQLRTLLKIGSFYWEGVQNQYEIARLAKLHPFVVQKGLAQIKNSTPQKLKLLFAQIEEIDHKAKTGQGDILLALDKMISK